MKFFSLMTSAILLSSAIYADTDLGNGTTQGVGAIAAGNNQTVYGAASGAYGTGSTVFGAWAETLPDLFSTPDYGYNTFSMWNGSTAVGFYSKTVGASNVAVGGQAQAGADLDYVNSDGTNIQRGGAATAVGYSSLADNSESSAFGFQSMAHGENSTSLGSHAIAGSDFSVALGAWSVSRDPWTVSVGDEVVGFYRRITNVADPINNHDAVNKQYADAILTSAKTYTDSALSSSGGTGGAVDLSPAYNYTNEVAGSVAAYAEMTAVNAAAQAESNANGYTDTQTVQAVKTANSYTDVKAAETLISANSYTDTKISSSTKAAVAQANGYTDEVAAELKKEINKSTALAAALAASPTIEAGKQSGLSLSSGHYHGSSAMAVAYARRLDSSTTLTLAASGTSGDIASRTSLSFSW